MAEPDSIVIVDIVDRDGFDRLPPCADSRFDHRSCDYWEDERGSKAARSSWWRAATPPPERVSGRPELADNPFAPVPRESAFNPFAATGGPPTIDPFGAEDDEPLENPFAPRRERSDPSEGVPRKLGLLLRGGRVSGTYAKVLEWAGRPAVYAQFGPLSAYPRAQQVRDLYPRLPQSPLPAVITCIATSSFARGKGLARTLVREVCDDLGHRGFSAVEAYPDLTLGADDASAAHTAFWLDCGFSIAAEDERFPVVRLELG